MQKRDHFFPYVESTGLLSQDSFRCTKVWTAISLSGYVSKSVFEYCVVFVLRKTRRKTLSGFLPPVYVRTRTGR